MLSSCAVGVRCAVVGCAQEGGKHNNKMKSKLSLLFINNNLSHNILFVIYSHNMLFLIIEDAAPGR
jgi:hypothetical protein